MTNLDEGDDSTLIRTGGRSRKCDKGSTKLHRDPESVSVVVVSSSVCFQINISLCVFSQFQFGRSVGEPAVCSGLTGKWGKERL